MSDRPRAWKYMGAGASWAVDGGVEPGDLYIATEPLTPDDVELVEPVVVTAEDVAWADFYADQEDRDGYADWHELDVNLCSRHHAAMARRINARLASRQATPEGES